LHTAQCLLEAWAELPDDHGLRSYRNNHGMAETRDRISALVIPCEKVYAIAKERLDYEECFDWEFVPVFLEHCVDDYSFEAFKNADPEQLFDLIQNYL